LSLHREDDRSGSLIELQRGTSLRYEHVRYSNGYERGEWHGVTRRFLVLDGEFAGARVRHSQITWRSEDGDWTEPAEAFPPAGLIASEHVRQGDERGA